MSTRIKYRSIHSLQLNRVVAKPHPFFLLLAKRILSILTVINKLVHFDAHKHAFSIKKFYLCHVLGGGVLVSFSQGTPPRQIVQEKQKWNSGSTKTGQPS